MSKDRRKILWNVLGKVFLSSRKTGRILKQGHVSKKIFFAEIRLNLLSH
ncbi:CLUMA_CG011316, isoform A [Clunio marinus]|uniref:CLUMA_CG011316, isoform A n=1 Tax=Clunio marinus TaxID=568069 RepID=A0A1J1ICC8_9DIPT|nr:CLUMA_CG011316, isoform A [Clunio marinus]